MINRIGVPDDVTVTEINFTERNGRRRSDRQSTGDHNDLLTTSALAPLGSNPVELIDFAELADGSLVEIIEDPENASRACLAVCKNGVVTIVNELENAGKILKPIPRDLNYVRHIRLPKGVAAYGSFQSLSIKILKLLVKCLDVTNHDRLLLTTFIVATWFAERHRVAPYLALIGLPGSGKSNVLEILNLLCRRPLLTADITSAAFYEVCDRMLPTLMIDEAATAGNTRALFHLLRTGISRGAVALRKNQSYKAFGPKVVSFTELPNDAALNSRCVVIRLHESRRTNFLRPTDRAIVAEAEDLQQQLLQYRLERLNTVDLAPSPGDEKLVSRNRDLYETLALASEPWRPFLVRSFTEREAFTREPLSPTHATLLNYLFSAIHGRMQYETVNSLTDLINSRQLIREKMRLNPREVGAALTALGITRYPRSAMGYKVFLAGHDKRKIHQLVETHGIDRGFCPCLQALKDCEFCQGITPNIYDDEI